MGSSLSLMTASQEIISQWCRREAGDANWSMVQRRKIKTIDQHFLNPIYKPQKLCLELGRLNSTKNSGNQSVPVVFFIFSQSWKTLQNMQEMAFSDCSRIFLERFGDLRGYEGARMILASYCQGSRAEKGPENVLAEPWSWRMHKVENFSLYLFLSLSLLPFLFSFLLPFFHTFLFSNFYSIFVCDILLIKQR